MAVPEGAGWHEAGYPSSEASHVDNFIADIERQEGGDYHNTMAVSYTHLTLPTIPLV